MRPSLQNLFVSLIPLSLLSFPAECQERLKINEKQAEILRIEANHLAPSIAFHRSNVDRNERLFTDGAISFQYLRDGLASPVKDAKESASETELLFIEASESDRERAAARAFFETLRQHYDLLSKEITGLEPPAANEPGIWPGFVRVRDKTLFTLETALLAYQVVSENRALTFDLDVRSEPQVGAVSYKRTGDQYQPHKDPTNTVIANLIYAIWTIRVQKSGYKDQEKVHDPFREKNHVVYFKLEKK